MSLPDISLNNPDLNRSHPIIIFTRPIQDGLLNRSTLIKGLTNLIRHEEIDDYFCFTELALNNLDLVNIDIVGDYISLKKLELRHNAIQDLSVLNSLNEIEYLDVSHNCLKRILNFNPPRMLYHVDYSYNNVEHMDDLSHFWSLAYLDLSHNAIEDVNGLLELNHLTFLNLSHNGIKHIHYSLPRSLMEINLSYNDLEYIQLDMSSSMCEILDLSHNKLKLLDFLKNAKLLSVLNLQANTIDDVLQIEYIKTLTNLRLLNVNNNDFIKKNIHKQLIFSNNLPSKSSVDQTFIKIDNLQELNEMEIYSLLMAEKNALKSTVLENLSGRSSIGGGIYCESNCRLVPMVILVGPPKTYKNELLNVILRKHADKFYQAIIYTTNEMCKNITLKTITVAEFNRMNSSGEFVFSYRFLGHSYGLNKDQLSKCSGENKVLITFTNLEGALILKNKGYNPTFVLVLPEDKLSYKMHIYESIQKYYMNQNRSVNENELALALNKGTDGQYFNETDNNYSSKSSNSAGFYVQSNTAVCSLETKTNSVEESKTIEFNNNDRKNDFNDPVLNDPCTIFTNECMNNLSIYHNLYEKSLDVFHSLVYIDNFQNASREIITIMIDVYNKYHTSQKTKIQKQPDKHTLEHLQVRQKLLHDELNQ